MNNNTFGKEFIQFMKFKIPIGLNAFYFGGKLAFIHTLKLNKNGKHIRFQGN